MKESKNIELNDSQNNPHNEEPSGRVSLKKRFMETTSKWSKTQKLALVYMLILLFFVILVLNTIRLYNTFFS